MSGTATDAVALALERLRVAEARLARSRPERSGLTSSERNAMRFIVESDRTSTEVTPMSIATRLYLSPSSATSLVDRLVARDLVRVSSHPSDRRKKLVSPTDLDFDPDRIDPLTTSLRALAGALSEADARVVAEFLEHVVDAVNATHP
ncbi:MULTISPECIES: MarR family transcriptional regulator [Microbacterium]|uniref:MarR family winged helix-turn-helix transcriptional regulator n=1 Tax=Microbacterium TaxID=33882 RepID=UPI000D6599FC|nr:MULTISPECIES: MarR family transcriptional regulator [Microbacterium]